MVPSIVVIEDDQRSRERLIRVLSQEGYDVDGAGTALDGLRRIAQNAPDAVVFDMALPDIDSDELLRLSPKEFDLLVYLAERAGVVVPKRELMAEVWRQPYGGSGKSIDVHLSRLRKKLGESDARSRYIQTVHGVGVKLVEPG